ncbi:MAG TPA: hypothetical protein VLV76_27835 [Candidatus Acidoferrum sp.]|nr:hypothetical protein [Candidatus Acidoferrum sp.]
MPKFVIAANVQYRERGQSFNRNAEILSVAPGESTTDWQTEKVASVDQLKQVFKAANDKKKITLMMKQAYATPSFSNNRNIDLVSLQFNERSSTGTGGRILTERCKDLTVIKSQPLTNEILQLAYKNNHITVEGVDAQGTLIVTLKFIDPGFSAS